MDTKGGIPMDQHKWSIAKIFILFSLLTFAVQLDYTADFLVDVFLLISNHPSSSSQWSRACHGF